MARGLWNFFPIYRYFEISGNFAGYRLGGSRNCVISLGGASKGKDRLFRRTSVEGDGEEGASPGRSGERGRSIPDVRISNSGVPVED